MRERSSNFDDTGANTENISANKNRKIEILKLSLQKRKMETYNDLKLTIIPSLIYLSLEEWRNFGFLGRNFRRQLCFFFKTPLVNCVERKQPNQDGRLVNDQFWQGPRWTGVILVGIMRGIRLDDHFIDFHYRIWSGRGIDEQPSRYRSTHAADLTPRPTSTFLPSPLK